MTNSISYIFKAVDDVTAVTRKISAGVEQVHMQVRKTVKSLEESSWMLKKVGESMSVFLSLPIVAFGVESVKAFNESEQAIAQLNAALKATHNAAGLTSEQLTKMADSLESKSLFEHSQILSGLTNQLLRFTSIRGQTFGRAQQDILDVATAKHRDLASVTVMVGKALDDPTQGLQRLARVGVVFSKTQEKVIETLAKTNKLGTAQSIILKALEMRFAGSAAAAAAAGMGPFVILQYQLKGLEEEIGSLIAKALLPMIPYLQEAIGYFKSLDPATKKMILTIVGITAVIGPLVVALGIMGLVLSSIGAAVTVILSPITLTIAAIAALTMGAIYAYTHFAAFREAVNLAGNAIVGFFTFWIALIKSAVQELKTLFNLFENNAIVGSMVKFGAELSTTVQHFVETKPASLAPLPSQNSHSSVAVNVNINDKNNNVHSVQTSQRGPARVNVGRNMAHVG